MKTPFFGMVLLFCLAAATAGAQDGAPKSELLPGLREQAVVLNITARIAGNQQELWNETNSKVTWSGKPVRIRLVGGNVDINILLTPYLRDKGNNVLVAQGQILVTIPNEKISYKTTMQAIPLAFGEQIYFLPLGSDVSAGNPHIELQIVLNRYEDALKEIEAAPEAESAAGG